jgi:hypothetical protein
MGQRALGEVKRRKAGAQGWAPESFCFASPRVPLEITFLLAKENPEGGRRPSFWVPLRGRLPVLHCSPFARLSGPPGTKRDRKVHRLNSWVACLVAASDSWPLFDVASFADSRLGPLSDPLRVNRMTHESFFGSLCGPHGRVASRTAKRLSGDPRPLP